jgi:DNA-binding LytR/AlgR family response regulator
MFARVGRSLIVNKRYIHVINLTEQILIFFGQQIKSDIKPVNVSRDALKQLKELLENEKGNDNG